MARQETVISHWYQLIENFQASSVGFYEALETAIQQRQVPELLANSRIEYKEGGILTAKRVYLRIIRGKHAFDVCAAPFGTGFFFSWWMTERVASYGILYLVGFLFALMVLVLLFFQAGFFAGLFLTVIGLPLIIWGIGNSASDLGIEDTILAIPILGWLYERIFQSATYYKADTVLMFQTAVHYAVLEVVDQMTTAKGVRSLSEVERKPILKAFAQSA